MPQSWSVVATVDEPAPLVVAFVLHHLEAGAERVHLFLDAPNPQAQEALAAIPQALVTLCDDAHWAACVRKRRPKLHTGRQLVNADIAYGQTRSGWLLHCDCDEFIRDGAAMAQELAELEPKHVYLRLQMAERAYVAPQGEDLFEGVFRLPIKDFALHGPPVYGDLTAFLKDGVTGHRAGKAVVRTGLNISVGIHSPDGPPPHRNAQTRLLHFDGLTRLHYMIKLLRRAAEPPTNAPPRHGAPRIAQFETLSGLLGHPERVRDLVERLKSVTPAQVDQLRAMGALDRRGFAPLGQNPLASGLTTFAFDADLMRRFGPFLDKVAPGLVT